MRKYLLQLISLAVISTTIYSCKLDPAILPGQPGYVEVQPPTGGGTGTGTGTGTIVVDDAVLTGKWKLTSTSNIIYTDGVAKTSPSIISLFTGVDMDDAAKTAIFNGAFNFSGNTTYVVSTKDGNTYIQFSEDPFSRSSNGPVQLVSITATSMTWIALDPLVITTGGHKKQSAWEVTYEKQ